MKLTNTLIIFILGSITYKCSDNNRVASIPINLHKQNNSRTYTLLQIIVGLKKQLVEFHLDLTLDRIIISTNENKINTIDCNIEGSCIQVSRSLQQFDYRNKLLLTKEILLHYRYKDYDFHKYNEYPKYPVHLEINENSQLEDYGFIGFGMTSEFWKMIYDSVQKRKTYPEVFILFDYVSSSRNVNDFNTSEKIIKSSLDVYSSFNDSSLKFCSFFYNSPYFRFKGSIETKNHDEGLNDLDICLDNNIDHFMEIRSRFNFIQIIKVLYCNNTNDCRYKDDLITKASDINLILYDNMGNEFYTVTIELDDILSINLNTSEINFNINEFNNNQARCDVYLGNLFLFKHNLLLKIEPSNLDDSFLNFKVSFVQPKKKTALLNDKLIVMFISIVMVVILSCISKKQTEDGFIDFAETING